ncbi:hypothetical protein CL628_00050 [bacterium]|nr:hypothetical protein [bacterium]
MRSGLILAALAILLILPVVVSAGSVWRTEISELQEPDTVSVGFWQQVRVFLFGQVAGQPVVGTTFIVTSSAYASSPYQTDDTPCVTAAGTRVRPGVVATNWLPLGTVLEINGDRYIVEDRMNNRFQGRFVDIWFPSTSAALEHGRQELEVEIVSYGTPGQQIRPDFEDEGAGAIDDPNLIKRTGLRLAALTRSVGRFLGAQADPDRFDIDCFAQDEPEE